MSRKWDVCIFVKGDKKESHLIEGLSLSKAWKFTMDYLQAHPTNNFKKVGEYRWEGKFMAVYLEKSANKLPSNGIEALEMFLEADFDRDGTAEVDGITLLKEERGIIEFVDYSESFDEPPSVCYKLCMKAMK